MPGRVYLCVLAYDRSPPSLSLFLPPSLSLSLSLSLRMCLFLYLFSRDNQIKKRKKSIFVIVCKLDVRALVKGGLISIMHCLKHSRRHIFCHSAL